MASCAPCCVFLIMFCVVVVLRPDHTPAARSNDDETSTVVTDCTAKDRHAAYSRLTLDVDFKVQRLFAQGLSHPLREKNPWNGFFRCGGHVWFSCCCCARSSSSSRGRRRRLPFKSHGGGSHCRRCPVLTFAASTLICSTTTTRSSSRCRPPTSFLGVVLQRDLNAR